MDLTERSEVPVPPCLIPVELKIDEGLTDLELFKMHCLPIVDRWDDVPWLIGTIYIIAVEFSCFFTVMHWLPKKKLGYSEVHMWHVLEYFASAKRINIPHGWDAWSFKMDRFSDVWNLCKS